MYKTLSNEETVEYILKHKCSIARYGDGEVNLMLGHSIPFQKRNKLLQTKLKKVHTTDKCLICVPDIFNEDVFNDKNMKSKSFNFWKKHLKFKKKKYEKFFSNNSVIGSTFISRFYIDFNDHSKTKEYVNRLKKLWENRNVVFVEGCKSRLGIGNDLFANAKTIKRILCPAKNAFEKYEQIVSAIQEFAKKDDLLICALGPTATVLAYEMSNQFQVLDMGHVDIEYEWFLRNAEKKIAIENKYVNECGSSGRKPVDCEDETYLSQIVKEIL